MPWLHVMTRLLEPLRERRGNVAMIFALSLVPLALVVGLAVDYSFYIQAKAQFDLASDAASTHAVRIAADAYANPAAYVSGATSISIAQAESIGQLAGQQWFLAQLGTYSPDYNLANGSPSVTLTALGTSSVGFRATTTYSGTVNTFIGHAITPTWPISNSSTAEQSGNSFIQIIMLLDNSSSMQIGAGWQDYQTMMQLTACVPDSSVVYPTDLTNLLPYGAYQCSDSRQGGDYTPTGFNATTGLADGSLACPLQASSAYPTSLPSAFVNSKLPPVDLSKVPLTSNLPNFLYYQTQSPPYNPPYPFTCPTQNGQTPILRQPCAFACHWDPSHATNPAQGLDYYGLARRNGVTLRFDLLKNATNQVLRTMKANSNAAIKNLQVGVYTFNSKLNPIYPGPNQLPVGNNFDTAISAVGTPPSGSTPESGILPETFNAITNGVTTLGSNHDDTDLDGALQNLLPLVGKSGDGKTVTTPSKYLFLVTDGYQDYDNSADPNSVGIGGIDVNQCTAFKNAGYTIYVVYTPYYPLMHYWYYLSNKTTVEGTGPGSLQYNLQKCSSDPVNDYLVAGDQASLTNALNTFLQSALSSAERVAK